MARLELRIAVGIAPSAGRDAKQRLGGRVRLVAGGLAGEHGRQLGAALVRSRAAGLGDGPPVDGALADDDVGVGVCRDLGRWVTHSTW